MDIFSPFSSDEHFLRIYDGLFVPRDILVYKTHFGTNVQFAHKSFGVKINQKINARKNI